MAKTLAPSKFGFIDPVQTKKVKDLIIPKRTILPYYELTDEEISNFIGQDMQLDIECYPNYFLIVFKHFESGKCIVFEMSPISTIDYRKLSWCLFAFRLVTFNGWHYDVPLISMCLKGYDVKTLKVASNMIIDEKIKPFDVMAHFNVPMPFGLNHVDIKEVCPVDGSLKKYAGRLHAQRMQELPYSPYEDLTQEQAFEVKNYCINADCDNTALLKNSLKQQLELRDSLSEKYGIDLRSKSDAQIAEAVIAKEIKKILGELPRKPQLSEAYFCQYKPPEFIKFQTSEFQQAYESIKSGKFYLDGKGSPKWPEGLGEREKNKKGEWVWVIKLKLNGTVYKIGMGGLHSQEKSVAHKSDADYILLDRDVASYYPRIVLNQGLFPKHLTKAFLKVYEYLVNSRLSAKKAKDNIAADALKIVINGAFGKLGSKYSNLYSPDLMLQVTLTGQLCLLMLIESLELNRHHVVSANTDGIVTKVKRSERNSFEAIVKEWESITNFETEETGYAAIYSKDVNNYIAVKYKEDDSTAKQNFGKIWLDEKEVCKLKGAYADPWPDKKAQIFRFHVNPTFQICTEAICKYLLNGTPESQTIRECKDITRFTAVRAVKFGAHKDRVYVGKFIRWYSSTETSTPINNTETGAKVADTEGGKPLMDLPDEFPSDIDYEWYIKRVQSMKVDIGYLTKDEIKGQGRFF